MISMEAPTLLLCSRDTNHRVYGKLNNVEDFQYTTNLNSADEISFKLHKYANSGKNVFVDVFNKELVDEGYEPLWKDILDLRYIGVVGNELVVNDEDEQIKYFELTCSIDESDENVMSITGTSAGEAELSQINIHKLYINNENDRNWNTENSVYTPTVFYNEKDTNASLLHRVLERAPGWKIVHVDSSLANLQRTFSIDGTSIYDFMVGDCAKEFNCIFRFNSAKREISAYDLYTICENDDCSYYQEKRIRYRGDFTDRCPKCGSKHLKYFGEDTMVYASTENLTESISFNTSVDNIKTCFRLEAGDDLMTTSVMLANPNGSQYIYYFSDELKSDMPKSLSSKLDSYDESFNYYRDEYEITPDRFNSPEWKFPEVLKQRYTESEHRYILYNEIVDRYNPMYKALNPDNPLDPTGDGKEFTKIATFKGHSKLITYLYESMELGSFLESSLMPSVKNDTVTVATEVKKLNDYFGAGVNQVAVNGLSKNTMQTTIDNSVKMFAKTVIKSGYVKVDIVNDSSHGIIKNSDGVPIQWKGKLVVSSYSVNGGETTETQPFIIPLTGDYTIVCEQILCKDFVNSLGGKDDYDILSSTKSPADFAVEIQKYSRNRLQSFCDAINSVITIIMAQDWDNGADASAQIKDDIYRTFYLPYKEKLDACTNELNIRDAEVKEVMGEYQTDKDGKILFDKDGNILYSYHGVQQSIEDINKYIQDKLNLRTYLGEEDYLAFCCYIREDTYSNGNYITDSLSNSQIMEKAREFIDKAEKELYTSGNYQHSISANLYNLLALPEFAPLKSKFKLGNWIRIGFNNKLYRLRLISYSLNFSDLTTINTEFSDVTESYYGLNDIKNIIDSAKQMASSYSATTTQVEQNSSASKQLTAFVKDGLNSALSQIKNNNNEEVVFDNTGLWAKKYVDVLEDYDPEQLRITHNILCFTKDNWRTTSTALGKHEYYRFDNDVLTRHMGYGLTAEFVTAGYIYGSQMIAGQIYSENWSPEDRTGIFIDLDTGEFRTGNSSITFTDGSLELKNTTIDFATVGDGTSTLSGVFTKINTDISTTDTNAQGYASTAESNAKTYAETKSGEVKTYVDGDFSTAMTTAFQTYTNTEVGKLDTEVTKYLTGGGTTKIGTDFVISPYIGGGYLNVSKGNYSFIVDPENKTGTGYLMSCYDKSKKTAIMSFENGNLTVTGSINATSGSIGSGNSKWNITDNAIYNGVTSVTDHAHTGMFVGTNGIHNVKTDYSYSTSYIIDGQTRNVSFSGAACTSIENGTINTQRILLDNQAAEIKLGLGSGGVYSYTVNKYGAGTNRIWMGDDYLNIGSPPSTATEAASGNIRFFGPSRRTGAGNTEINSTIFEQTIDTNNMSRFYVRGSTDSHALVVTMNDGAYFQGKQGLASGYRPIYASEVRTRSGLSFIDIKDGAVTKEMSKRLITSITPLTFDYLQMDGADSKTPGTHRGFSVQDVYGNAHDIGYPDGTIANTDTVCLMELIPDIVACIQDIYSKLS